jgi:hypothetical protein
MRGPPGTLLAMDRAEATDTLPRRPHPSSGSARTAVSAIPPPARLVLGRFTMPLASYGPIPSLGALGPCRLPKGHRASSDHEDEHIGDRQSESA